jgi:hypothetical protein
MLMQSSFMHEVVVDFTAETTIADPLNALRRIRRTRHDTLPQKQGHCVGPSSHKRDVYEASPCIPSWVCPA